jgi:hypothetical protein
MNSGLGENNRQFIKNSQRAGQKINNKYFGLVRNSKVSEFTLWKHMLGQI